MTTALLVVGTCAVVLLGVLGFGLLRSRAGIATGSRKIVEDAPPDGITTRLHGSSWHGTGIDGRPFAVAVGGTDPRTVLLFLTSTCATCHGVWAALGSGGAAQLPGGTRAVVVTEDAARERLARLRTLAPAPAEVPVLLSSAVWAEYGVDTAPQAVLVDGSGAVVARGGVETWADAVAMVEMAR